MNNFRTHANILGYTLILIIISRLILYLVGFLGINLFSHYTEPPQYKETSLFGAKQFLMLPESLDDTRKLGVADMLKFDSFSYLKIADQGYDRIRMDEPHPPANWVFFPLYPLSVSLVSKLLPFGDTLTVGLLMSNLYLWLALYLIYLIGLEKGLSHGKARSVVFLILLFPASLYFSAFYTESLFLLLSAASVYFAMTKRYGWAFLAAGLSTVTRIPGIANLLFVGGHLLITLRFRITLKDWKYLVYALLSTVPLLAYFSYLKWLTGDFLAAIHEMDNWGRAETFPFEVLFHYLKHPYFISSGGWDNGIISFIMSMFVIAIFVTAFAVQWRRFKQDWSLLLFFLYGVMLLVIPFSSAPNVLTSVVRYMMVSIPLYFYIQELGERSDLVSKGAIALFAAMQAFYVIGFFNNYFFVV